ncbi:MULTISPECIES: hypothetical protein [Caballeronia]|uniref:hypothetical protein n=1 Tax=Caballeronia TaxID=1827195 RepID=UPI00158CC4FB|nr:MULTISPECIES: hypothetical protein [Caballeronia]MCG7401998.1 hypothetical protein [Caballeronia zhejiangensis]MCI1042599.1 hypothetical protein [Caballeronia zhejiangensis]
MSTFARIAANRLRDMQFPLTEHERLSYATLFDFLSNDLGRCHVCLQQLAQIIGNENSRAGDDLTIELAARLYHIINGDNND